MLTALFLRLRHNISAGRGTFLTTLLQRPVFVAIATLALALPSAAHTRLDGAGNVANDKTPSTTPITVLGKQIDHKVLDNATDYWIDEAGDATVAQADAASINKLFSPRAPGQSHAIHGKALWMRFEAQIADPTTHWFLEVSLTSTDDVRLFWHDSSGRWVTQRSGDTLPRSQWPAQDRFPVFKLSHETTAPVVYYMRVVHHRTPFSAPLQIYRDTELVSQRQRENFFLGAYFGLLLLVGLVCVAMSLAMRDTIFVQYLGYVTTIGAAQASYTGIAAQYLWPEWPAWSDTASFFLPTIASVAGLWFVRILTNLQVYMPRLDKIAVVLILVQTAVACSELVYPTLLSFRLLTLLCVAMVIVVYVVAWNGWTRGDMQARWIALAFLPVVIGVVPQLLRNMGFIHSNFATQYGVTLGSAIEMPLLLYGLMLRANARSEARGRAAGLPLRDALTGLSNMRDLLRQVHGAMTRAVRYQQQYGLVLIELTNYDWFVKEHGREISDRALVLLGTRLQLAARDVDTTGRIDDKHFVLLIEGPCKPGYAAKVAARIAASAHRPSDLLPVGAALKLRITCALMPDPEALALGDDANAQLGWLLDSSEALPNDPRKSLRTLNF
jgi:two-component system, sensor histidine kinase LadS